MALRALTTLFAVAALFAVSGNPTGAAAELAPGKPAPEFTAKDSNGRDVALSSFKGRTVVLEWTNEGCPYVRKHYGAGNMQAIQKSATDKNVVWLTIASSAPGMQGHVNGLEAGKWMDENKAKPTAFLLDPEGKVGRLYDAKTTPHMFVIDKSGMLAYMGAIDDKPTANPADIPGARNYATEALAAVAEGKPVKTASTRPYGCSVKYSAPKS
jgi:AhpC/TSA family